MSKKRIVDTIAFSIRKYSETEEFHIFEGRFTPDGCSTNRYSICEKFDRRDENVIGIATCLDEGETRKKAAELGRKVCGICVSHLYTTYEEE